MVCENRQRRKLTVEVYPDLNFWSQKNATSTKGSFHSQRMLGSSLVPIDLVEDTS